tara:strand:+ start:686 stop:931 length:246 start_codon:yes stop_codon:yes gene_type:complete
MKKIIFVVCFLVFSLFFTVTDCFADETGNELNNNLSEKTKPNNIKNNNRDIADIPKASSEDIFGDEQAFPFIAGLGKNAAH